MLRARALRAALEPRPGHDGERHPASPAHDPQPGLPLEESVCGNSSSTRPRIPIRRPRICVALGRFGPGPWLLIISLTVRVINDGKARVTLGDDATDLNSTMDVGFLNSTMDVGFQADSIDFGVEPPCGANKCLFRTRGPGDGVGFLVAPRRKRKHMLDQWEAAEYLSSHYARRQLLLGPPAEHEISEDLAARLNRHDPEKARYDGRRPVVVQSVRVAPSPTMLIGCCRRKQERITEGLGPFIDAFVDNGEGFLRRLKGELLSAARVMNEQPWYARDWQALVDGKGELFDIDVHAMEEDPVGNRVWVDLCCDTLEEVFKRAAEHTANKTARHAVKVVPDEEKFHWASLRPLSWGDDLDALALDPSKCGQDRCTVPSLSNPIVAYEITNARSDTLASNWKMAKLLSGVYRIRHNVLGRPERVDAAKLKPGVGRLLDGAPVRWEEGEALLVQRLLRHPSGEHFLFSCGGSDGPSNLGGLKRFVRAVVKKRRRFLRRLSDSAAVIYHTIKRYIVSIPSTFQAFVDSDGQIYLLDLHAMAFGGGRENATSVSKTRQCIKEIMNLEKFLED